MKVIFTYYPAIVRYNHGSALLASICREAGIEAYIFPMDDITDLVLKVKMVRPDYICVSYVCSGDYHRALPFVMALKDTGIPMIAGGTYPRRGAWIKPGIFEHVCRGEAERLPDFLLKGDTSVFSKNEYCEDISTLPLPDYGAVTGFEFSRNYPFLKSKRILPYCGSRGCPSACSFCEIRFQPKGVRIRKTIKQDLDFLYERHIPDLFYFMDTLLPYYRSDWRDQVAGNPYPFLGYIRADIMPLELEFLQNNGLAFCAFGIESGSEQYRNNILKKNLSDKDIWRTVDALNRFGIEYAPFFMVNTPYETQVERNMTLAMAKTIGGHPTVWDYEDLNKKIFLLPDEAAESYCRRFGKKRSELLETFDFENIGVETEGNNFFSYEVLPDAIFVNDFFGNIEWAIEKQKKLCLKWNKNKIRAITKSKAFLRLINRHGFNLLGSIIELGVE